MKPTKPYSKMNTDELADATREFDTNISPEQWQPMTLQQRARWERSKRGRGRPVVGEGAERIFISMERRLLRVTDEIARRLQKNRSQLIAVSLRQYFATIARGQRPLSAAPADGGIRKATKSHPTKGDFYRKSMGPFSEVDKPGRALGMRRASAGRAKHPVSSKK